MLESRVWHQHYDPGVLTSIDYPDHPVDYFLKETAHKYPHLPALVFGGMLPRLGEQHQVMTYHQLNVLVDRFAAGLQQLGLQKGDRIALYLPNCPQFVIAYYGALRAGGIVVPINPLYVAREIQHLLDDAKAKFAVTLSLFYAKIKQVRATTSLEQVIVTNIKEYFPGLLKMLFSLLREKKEGHRVNISADAQTHWFQDLLTIAPTLPRPVEVARQDTAVLMYTGGTTGIPKGAQLSHKNIVANAIQEAVWLAGGGCKEGQEVMLTALPLTHSYGMTICMNYSVFYGHKQILIPNPRDLTHLLNAINIHQPTIFPGVPALYNAINNDLRVKSGRYNLKSIKTCVSGATGLPLEVQQEFERITGGKLVEVYGLTEASPGVIANPIGSGGRSGSVGLPVSNTDAKIVDIDTETEPVGFNQPGILCVRGPQVMTGYWGMPTETANALRPHADGQVWLHTGDIAEMSEDGYFRIVDRKKEMILAAGGFNVYPRDIEERLYEHPKVLEATAIGVPVGSPHQHTKAYVVLKPGETATQEEIIEWCRAGLAKYKVPKFVEFRLELPKSMVGKVLRRYLMEEEAKAQASTR